MGFTLEFCLLISPEPFDWFSLSFTQMFLSVSWVVVECLTRNWGAPGLILNCITALCPWARHINSSLVLVQPSNTCPYVTEWLLMGRKESNQTSKLSELVCKTHDSAMQTQSQGHTLRSWNSTTVDKAVLQIAVLCILEIPILILRQIIQVKIQVKYCKSSIGV